ncbi:MAG: N-acetylneuraminate synthase family protein [Deltaproteobacteria bacterium]|nr:N-acetylneuraminate synthase family protein [Deltaproteobacteria bacterium]
MEIIAEIGQNHNGDMSLAKELIHAAKENGADAAKFQLYDARSLFPRENNPWFDYNCKTELSMEQLFLLEEECRKADIEFLASVFDIERVSWLEKAGIKRYKVASRSIADAALLAALVQTGKPLLVSLGMWDKTGFPAIAAKNVGYMYCISKYPVPLNELHLSLVDFQKYIGFSDHSIGITAAFAAFARGCRIIEKHFTLDKGMVGPDHTCSMTPGELHQLHIHRLELDECL